MTKTFNRSPWYVDTPSKNDVKNYFFNTTQWSGLCNNKNVIGVDQYSFEEVNNIYVDFNNVLRSRPPIRKITQNGINNIINTWSFQNIQVYQIQNSPSDYEIKIDNNGVLYSQECEQNILPIKIDSKIFIFSETSFKYFDTDLNEFGDASKYIYVPKTTVTTNSIETKNEEENELTTSQIHEYIYSESNGLNFSDFVGKTITVKVSNIEYVINNFTLSSRYSLVRPFVTTLSDVVKFSEVGSFITYNGDTITYSVDGKTYEYLPPIGDIFKEPYFTNDGTTVFVIKEDGIYAISVVATEEGGIKKYSSWTKISVSFDEGETITNLYDCVFDAESNWVVAVKTKTTSEDVVTATTKRLISNIYGSPVVTTFKLGESDAEDDEVYEDDAKMALYSVKGQLVLMALLYKTDTSTKCLFTAGNEKGIISTAIKTFTISYFQKDTNIPAKNCGLTIGTYNSPDTVLINIVTTFSNDESESSTLVNISYSLEAASSLEFSEDYVVIDDYCASTNFIISLSNKNILSNYYCYVYNQDGDGAEYDSVLLPMSGGIPIYNEQYLVYKNGEQIYTNKLTDNSEDRFVLSVKEEGIINYKLFENVTELNSMYLSIGNTLYISQNTKDEDGNFMWYLPKINTQKFNSDITNLHIISTSEVGIFLEDSIWYCTLTDYGYSYVKSKLQVGCKKGSDVITSFDGKYILFPCKIGFVQMSYQDFIASTEQSLTNLTDNINDEFFSMYENPIKVFKYQYWYILYNEGFKNALLLDIRSLTWWPWSYSKNIQNIYESSESVRLLCNGEIYGLSKNDTRYFDDDDKIFWKIVSQKLHLNAINNYKHISNITINAIENNDRPFTFGLKIKLYRGSVDERPSEIMDYDVDIVKTYVKRLNFMKVNFFQYEMSSDDVTTNPSPLYITSLTIKYKVSNEVR